MADLISHHVIILLLIIPGMGCAYYDIDVSPAMFNNLADPAKGRVNVEWAWL
jgi:hypothetical protein